MLPDENNLIDHARICPTVFPLVDVKAGVEII
jgi:hypothetical protein